MARLPNAAPKPRKKRKPAKRPIARSAKPRPRKRSAKDFARIYGSEERVAWVKTLPCFGGLLAGIGILHSGPCSGEIANCHTVAGGMGYKAGFETIAAGCARHHQMFDQRKAPFDQTMVRDLVKRQADQTEKAWQDRQAREG